MQLILVGLGHGSQTVQMTQQLHSVVRLDVVHPVAEHLQQSVKDSPRVTLEHVGQQLAWADERETRYSAHVCPPRRHKSVLNIKVLRQAGHSSTDWYRLGLDTLDVIYKFWNYSLRMKMSIILMFTRDYCAIMGYQTLGWDFNLRPFLKSHLHTDPALKYNELFKFKIYILKAYRIIWGSLPCDPAEGAH